MFYSHFGQSMSFIATTSKYERHWKSNLIHRKWVFLMVIINWIISKVLIYPLNLTYVSLFAKLRDAWPNSYTPFSERCRYPFTSKRVGTCKCKSGGANFLNDHDVWLQTTVSWAEVIGYPLCCWRCGTWTSSWTDEGCLFRSSSRPQLLSTRWYPCYDWC